MGGAVFWLLLVATCAAMLWAFWPRRQAPQRRSGGSRSPAAASPAAAAERRALPAGPGAAGTAGPAAGHELPSAPDPSPDSADPASAAPPGDGERTGRRQGRSRGNRQGRTPLFAFGGPQTGREATYRHTGDYACLQVVTTGFSAARERVVEVAVVRCTASGSVRSRWTTLLDVSRDSIPGASVHGVTPGILFGAPDFMEVAPDLLSQLQGCVVVTHNGDLVESFLAAEFLRIGMLAPTMPALDLHRLGPLAVGATNPRLATLSRAVGQRRPVPSSALEDACLLAALVPTVLNRYGDRLTYAVAPAPDSEQHGRHRRPARTLDRPAGAVGVPPHGWLDDLLAELSMSAAEGHDSRLAAYLDALASVLPTGRIVAEEVRELTGMAARAGFPANRLRSVLERLLESMRVTAFARGQVTPDQVRHLRAAAVSVGIPTYFDDLVQAPPPPAPEPGSGTFSRPVRKPLPPPPPRQGPRCGHCLQFGHYTASCPRLRRGGRGGSMSGPVGPVEPIRPI